MKSPTYSMEDLKKTLKPADSWWTVLVIDPLATRITLWSANRTRLHPNLFTAMSILLSIGSGMLFYSRLFIAGAIVYEISFLLDCVDGKLAILKELDSDTGLWLDTISDKIRLLANAFGLAAGSPHVWKLALIFLGLYLWDETEHSLFREILSKETAAAAHKTGQSERPLMIRIRDSLRRRRLLGPFNPVEQDTFAFFIGPLLGNVRLGLALAILINVVGRVISISHFWMWRHKGGSS